MKHFYQTPMLISTMVFSIALGLLNGCSNKPPYDRSVYIQELNAGLMEAVVQDGFSPPVSSRVYAYPNIAAYEAVIHGDTAFVSYAGQLKGLSELPQPDKAKDYVWEVVMIQAFSDVARNLVYRDYIIDNKQKVLFEKVNEEGCDEDAFAASVDYGKVLGKAINEWAGSDYYKETRNYPKFTASNTAGCWSPTAPKYMEALEPHWPKVRPFVIDTVSHFRKALPYAYSTDTTSQFFGIATQMYDITCHLDSDKLQCMKFWDDNPSPISFTGHVVTTNRQNTPGGHWLCITRSIAKEKKLNLVETCEVLSQVSIAIADAFKVIWDTKYTANNLRPCTYICKYINADWSPLLETPNFPEFTSGHSGVSAAAAHVLTTRFGDQYAFTDSSNVPFGFAPRRFASFHEAAKEAAISRVYGGIHYQISCEAGEEQGIELGKWMMENLHTRKAQ